MIKLIQKKHYNFTLYRLECYYTKEVSKNNGYLISQYTNYARDRNYNEITTVNHSCYKKILSLDFFDEQSLKKFLRLRYEEDNICHFYTSLGKAIKSANLHSASDFVAIVHTSTEHDQVFFELKKPKKKNTCKARRKNRYGDFYASSYAWAGKEFKNKTLEKSRLLDY